MVGLDLSTGQEIRIIDEADVPFWRHRGWSGDQTLVCVHCYAGVDGSARRVALIPKGRVGGRRRAHFAHPPGQAPSGGVHHLESVWHAEGKQDLAAWARTQPGVAEARVEAFTADGRRRSDVQIRFSDGSRVALELQSRWVTDDEWLCRHRDYQRVGVRDVWLWHPRVGVPPIVAEHGQPGWTYATERDRLTALVGTGAARDAGWWDTDDLAPYGPRWPAPRGMRTRAVPVGFDMLTLSPTGPALPEPVVCRWRDQVQAAATAEKTAAEAAEAAQMYARSVAGHAGGVASGPDIAPAADAIAAPSSDAGLGTRRYVDPAAMGQRAGLARIDARPPDAEPDRQLYVCRACDVFLPGDNLDDHLDCRWP
ncbi:competence protein CoiA family protein [Actinomycetospora flava]|uniref:Competence protein CoiA family protein n=1 Tax=Actinomycetospora flava TaxID=3129232 RepID=A0ABU8MEY3_9PSEU